MPVSNQPQYSALWRRIEARVLPVCEEYGVGNVVWSPLAMGILSGKYTDVAHPPAGTRAAGPNREMMEDYFTQRVLDAVAKTATARGASWYEHVTNGARLGAASAGGHKRYRGSHQSQAYLR